MEEASGHTHSPSEEVRPLASLEARLRGEGEEARRAEARHARQQTKRLLHFLKKQLAADLSRLLASLLPHPSLSSHRPPSPRLPLPAPVLCTPPLRHMCLSTFPVQPCSPLILILSPPLPLLPSRAQCPLSLSCPLRPLCLPEAPCPCAGASARGPFPPHASRWHEEGARPCELADEIGRRRTLASQLESTLQRMCDAEVKPSKTGEMKPPGSTGGGAAIRVQGMSLPRSVAVNNKASTAHLYRSPPRLHHSVCFLYLNLAHITAARLRCMALLFPPHFCSLPLQRQIPLYLNSPPSCPFSPHPLPPTTHCRVSTPPSLRRVLRSLSPPGLR